jgi:hypothetical protein
MFPGAAMNETTSATEGGRRGWAPDDAAITDLLRRVSDHPLGTDFLQFGTLDAVAVTFGVHAFVVDAARDALNGARCAETEVLAVRPPAATR